jgi:transposase InsO family protein
MPWLPKDLMDTKREFVELALTEGANRRELCRRFGISAKTGYALINRYVGEGPAGLLARSRRPLSSPARSAEAVEQSVVKLRAEHPRWGARKLATLLRTSGYDPSPTPSTVTRILHRHGLITPEATSAATPWQRFEHDAPNALWQMDFKGHFDTPEGRCNPLTVLDDHSRYSLAIAACKRIDTETVQSHLARVFGRYGLPLRINADNGPPWGTPKQPQGTLSELAIWLIRLGIQVTHSAPYHPQTNGKIERFHRSLKAEVLQGRSFADMNRAQRAFDEWREVYNHVRPHDAVTLQTPSTRYAPSERNYKAVLEPIEYAPDDIVVNVKFNGWLKFKGHDLHLSSALNRLPVAFREDPKHAGRYDVMFCHHRITQLDLADLSGSQ